MRLNNVTFGYATIDNLEILVLLNTRISLELKLALEILYYYLFLHLIITNIHSKPQLQQRCNKEIKYQDGPFMSPLYFI